MDSVVDRHACHGSDLSLEARVAYLPEFLVLALKYFAREGAKVNVSVNEVSARLTCALSQQRTALNEEAKSRKEPFVSWQMDYLHLWARSSCFTFLLDYIFLLAGRNLDEALLEQTRTLLFLIQRGDDSCDWREDFLNDSPTPFLRLCSDGTPVSSLSLSFLEEKVYLEGHMEKELLAIREGFMECEKSLAAFQCGRALSDLAEYQRNAAEQRLNSLRSIKAFSVR